MQRKIFRKDKKSLLILDKEISKKEPATLKSLVMLYWLSRAQRKDHLHGPWSRWQSRDLRTAPLRGHAGKGEI